MTSPQKDSPSSPAWGQPEEGLSVVRAGIIGGGMIAAVHAASIRAAGHELAGIAGRSEESTLRSAELLGTLAYGSADDLIVDPSIDVVHICSPNSSHFDYAMAAINAGKAVVCEKPLGVDISEARQLRDAALKAGVATAVPFVYRFYPAVREMQMRVSNDNPLLIRASYLQDWLSLATTTNWRVSTQEGGSSRAFADIGVHVCDLVEFVTGVRISRLTARTFRSFEKRGAVAVSTEDGATLMFDTDTGTPGTVTISQVSQGSKNRLEIAVDCVDGSYQFNQEDPEKLVVSAISGTTIVARSPENFGSGEAKRLSVLPPGHPQGYQHAFDSFIDDAYANFFRGAKRIVPSFEDGYRAAVLTAAVLESHSAQNWVVVSDFAGDSFGNLDSSHQSSPTSVIA
jgi:predicted dehydrogenase